MIVSIRREGIANRMKCLVSCLHLEPDDAYIYWEPEINIYTATDGGKVPHRKPVSFNDMFDNPIAVEKPFPKHAKTLNTWRLVLRPDDKLPEGFSTTSGLSDAAPQGRDIDFEYNRIPKRVRHTFIDEFKKLKVKDEVQREIQRFVKRNPDYIALHIRSWADVSAKGRRNLYSLENWVQEIKSYPSEQKFFVASDAMSVIHTLKEQFPEQIIYLPIEDKSTVDDLKDLYLLSYGSKIIGSHLSTFTEVAWWLAGCPKNIKVI